MNKILATAIAKAFLKGRVFQLGIKSASLGMDESASSDGGVTVVKKNGKLYKAMEEGDHWVTVFPNGEEEEGVHVLLSGGGKVKGGMGGKFNGEDISNLPLDKEEKGNDSEPGSAQQKKPKNPDQVASKADLKRKKLTANIEKVTAKKDNLLRAYEKEKEESKQLARTNITNALLKGGIPAVRPEWASKKITGTVGTPDDEWDEDDDEGDVESGRFRIFIDPDASYGEDSHDFCQPRQPLGHWEEQSLNFYTDTGYYKDINGAIRDPDKGAEQVVWDMIKRMDSAFAKAGTTKPMVLVRGITAASFLRHMQKDGTFTDPAFLSYSAYAESAFHRAPVWLVSRVPQGFKALSLEEISGYGPDESEILLNRGSRQKVVGMEKIKVGNTARLIVYTDVEAQ